MSKRDKAETGALIYGGVPRARLMPPEVAFRRKESARRRSLVVLTALVAAVTVAGVVAAFLNAAAAEQRLAAERLLTEQLLAQQLEFTEVTQVRADLQIIADLRTQLGAVDVLWLDALAPYFRPLGSGATVDALTVISDAPAQPQLGLTGPLRQPRVATISMTIVTPEEPAPWLWLRAWELLPTYADASIDRITLSDAGYETVVTINLNAEALSGRFSPDSGTDGQSEGESEGESEESTDGTGTDTDTENEEGDQ